MDQRVSQKPLEYISQGSLTWEHRLIKVELANKRVHLSRENEEARRGRERDPHIMKT